VTDENMFLNMPEKAFSIKIGKKKTAAKYFMRKSTQLLALLNTLN
jgi:trehalose-6-phosphatase